MICCRIFKSIDGNGDGHLSHAELRALIVGIHFNEISVDENEVVERVLKDFDTSLDSKVEFNEFMAGVGRWLEEARNAIDEFHEVRGHPIHVYDRCDNSIDCNLTYNFLILKETRIQHNLVGNVSEESGEGDENARWNSIKAALLLLLGSVIAAATADPLVDAVNGFSAATSIPTFFISFIALPMATNSSEAVSAIIFASRKKVRSASLTFSEVRCFLIPFTFLFLSVCMCVCVCCVPPTWNHFLIHGVYFG